MRFMPRPRCRATGDYDHRVNWSLSPDNAGTVSPTGLFISGTAFTGTATIKATSVENPKVSGTADIIVSTGSDAKHVDLNNHAPASKTAPRSIPTAPSRGPSNNIRNGDTVKVAQGTYIETVGLPWNWRRLAPGRLQGGQRPGLCQRQAGRLRHPEHGSRQPGHHHPVSSSSPHQSGGDPGDWTSTTPLTYAVDGFTVTGGSHGFDVAGWHRTPPHHLFHFPKPDYQQRLPGRAVITTGAAASRRRA